MKELGKYQSIELTIELAVENGEQKHRQRKPKVTADGDTDIAKRKLNLPLIYTLVVERWTFEKKSSPDMYSSATVSTGK